MTSIGKALRRGAIVAMVVLAAGLGASPASAASSTLGFFQPCDNPAYVGLRVQGQTNLAYPGGRAIVIMLWGSDPAWDDELAGPFVLLDSNTYPNQPFEYYVCVSPSTLNEDWGTDEVYAAVAIHARGASGYLEQTTTNIISHSF